MDIQAIQDAIAELEQSDTTVDNVNKLASLYICKEHLINTNRTSLNTFKANINDILPAYRDYCNIKRNFQLGSGSEEAVLESLSILCCEIKDLYISLYSSSTSRKEHKILKDCLESLFNK